MAWRRIGRAALGAAAGTVAGGLLALALVVFRARVLGHYLHGPAEALDAWTLPLLLLIPAGAWFGWARPRLMGRAILGAVGGLAVGAATGAGVGVLIDSATGPWAGSVLGAGLGVLVGTVGSLVWAIQSDWWEGHADSPVEPGATRAARWAGAGLLLVAWWSTTIDPNVREASEEPVLEATEPDTALVESAIFLVGDAGAALTATSPLLQRLRADVDAWSEALEADSSVVVLALGDLIYPDGMSDTASVDRASDSLHIHAQVELVGGPVARERGARLVMIPGNHDWGEARGYAGVVHLELLEELLESYRAEEWAVGLLPAPGTGGPAILDLGEHVRILILDTAWWLLGAEGEEAEGFLEAVREAIEGAEDRRILIAAHHPYQTGGPHGFLTTFSGITGARMVLSRSGAMLQDLHSGPYRRLLDGLRQVFATTRPPDLFAGGHEHSLQVIDGLEPHDPPTNLVSGSGSKLTDVGDAPGMRIGRAEPGWARLLVLKDGSMRLYLESAPARYLHCPEEASETVCITEGVAAFRTVWSAVLPHPQAPT